MGREEWLITDWWPRERKAVFNSTQSREAHGRTPMKKARKKRKQQGCKITEMIDAIEKAASTAMKIYRAVEPIAKAILKNGRRIK